MLKTLHSIRFRGRARLFVFLALAVAEGLYGWHLWEASRINPDSGYLLKVGHKYMLVWTLGQMNYDSLLYPDMGEALAYAREHLNLDVGRYSYGSPELEWLSLDDRSGAYLLQWKTFEVGMLHQLTFWDRAEATRFALAIREGAYAPSPFGHSLLLRPKSAVNR